MSGTEIVRAFLQLPYARKWINSRRKQRYFFIIVRTIATMSAPKSTSSYWSYCAEAHYYIMLGHGKLEAAAVRLNEASANADWFESVGYNEQIKRIQRIIENMPKDDEKVDFDV